MGGGRAMATAAKVAGIGVAKGGFRGGFGFSGLARPATEQFRVKNAAPVSASISSAALPSVEDESVITHRPVWDDWEFAEEEPTIPRVVFSKPPSLDEAKEATEDLKETINSVYMSSSKSPSAMEGSNEGVSVSRILSNFQSSENKAIESSAPQVALQAFAFLSENTAAQTVVASIASDPKVWDAVMENKDLMKFLQANNNNTVESDDNDDKSENSSTIECELSEAKPIDILEIVQDMKLKALRLMENISTYFGGLFGAESITEDGKDEKKSLLSDPRSLYGLAVAVIFMIVLKRAY